MLEYRITLRCQRQPDVHAKILRLRNTPEMPGTIDRLYVEGLARILDGTSPFYIYAPGPDSTIGKCATCGGQLESSIEEREVE